MRCITTRPSPWSGSSVLCFCPCYIVHLILYIPQLKLCGQLFQDSGLVRHLLACCGALLCCGGIRLDHTGYLVHALGDLSQSLSLLIGRLGYLLDRLL